MTCLASGWHGWLALGLLTACGPATGGFGGESDGGSDTDSVSDGGTNSAGGSSSATTSSTAGSASGGGGSASGGGGTPTGPGATTSGSASGPGPRPDDACERPEDCGLLDDCCNCTPYPTSQGDPETCPADCDQGKCSEIGMEGVGPACRLGMCELAPVNCDASQAVCALPPPRCPDARVPRVVNGCWGGCVEIKYCASLPACTHDRCGPGWICVESQTTFRPHCEPLPPGCNGEPTCDCLGPHLDQFCQGGCVDTGQTILCADGG